MIWFRLVAFGMLAVFGTGCNHSAAKVAADRPHAKVAKIASEGELNTIVLTPEAEQRLGIKLAQVETRSVSRVRDYGGEIVLPPGASLAIAAPVGGKLSAPEPAAIPSVGTLVTAKQPVYILTPLLSPERDVLTPSERVRLAEAENALATSRVDAQGLVDQAEVQVEATQIALERAERLLREQAGTVRAVDDAKAQLSLATQALEAAQNRKKLLDNIKVNVEGSAGQQTPLVIESPQDGMIRSRAAAAGEVVAAGAPLFEVMQFDPIWVRVPVYAGETADLDLDNPAQILPLADYEKSEGLTAKPIVAPPTATLLAATVDLYYELPNPAGALRPGQRMTVRIKQLDAGDQQVVPWSAVIHDYHGGTWVYVKTAEHTYVRHRVQVRYVVDDVAVLDAGPKVGSQVVTTAVVELFGTEFGFAK
jgi:RND family efflux transporter MFP subunit